MKYELSDFAAKQNLCLIVGPCLLPTIVGPCLLPIDQIFWPQMMHLLYNVFNIANFDQIAMHHTIGRAFYVGNALLSPEIDWPTFLQQTFIRQKFLSQPESRCELGFIIKECIVFIET